MIICLDLGTKCGWAIRDAGGSLSSGTVNFAPQRFEGGGMRYVRFKRWLNELRSAGAVQGVYFEEVRRHMGVDAAHCYGGLMAHLTEWCEQRDPKVPYEGIPVGTIKKHWTGKGNATKEQMIAEAVRRGLNVVDDNEADALAILDFVEKREPKAEPDPFDLKRQTAPAVAA